MCVIPSRRIPIRHCRSWTMFWQRRTSPDRPTSRFRSAPSTASTISYAFGTARNRFGWRSTTRKSERGECGVQRGARPHRGRYLGVVGLIVAADVDRLALGGDQLGIDLGLVLAERLGQRFEAGLQLLILGLRRQGPGPIQNEVEMGATIVELAD